jgi:hypothetical protein
MDKKLDWFIRCLILAPIVPLASFLSFWWIAFAILSESLIPWLSGIGLLVGIMIDVILLPELLERKLSMLLWGAVFLFYSVCVFGFFMGFPVFIVILAIPVGYVVGSRLAMERADNHELRKAAFITALLFSLLLTLISLVSALIAISSPSTPNDMRGMLGLNFDITRDMIWGLILVGGSMLIMSGWGLTLLSVWASFSILKKRI